MTQTIRTKWHKVLPLIEADLVYLTAPKDGKSKHWAQFRPRRETVRAFIKDVGDLPKFVIESELMEIATQENYQKSLLDMKTAGVLRLPYPAITVEFDSPNCRVIIMLRDNKFKERLPWEPEEMDSHFRNLAPFYGIVIRVHHDANGEYLVLSPSICSFDIQIGEDGTPMLQLWGTRHELFEDESELMELLRLTCTKDTAWVWRGLTAAMLLMHTGGVAKEVIECEKINRKRRNDRKPPIPRHIYLRIGHVYRSATSDESEQYVARKSPMPHWRKGHVRSVRYGKGRSNIKHVYIYPKLVAFREFEGPEPSMKREYHVSK